MIPLDRVGRPGALEPAGDRVDALAGAEGVLPAEALLFDARALRLGADVVVRVGRAVRFAKGVPAGDQRDGLLVVHGHAPEGLADVLAGEDRVRVAARALRVHVYQTHLDRAERLLEVAWERLAVEAAGVALVSQAVRVGFRPPIDILLRLPDVFAAEGRAERLEAHRLHRAVAGEDHQIAPGQLLAVLGLDRPEQPAGLVEVAVVRPAVERREALVAGVGAAAAIEGAVGAGGMPSHADEERAVVAVVGGPPVLGVGHDLEDVLLEGLNVKRLDLLRIAPARLAGGRVEERELERRRRRLGELEVLEEGALVRHLFGDESGAEQLRRRRNVRETAFGSSQ